MQTSSLITLIQKEATTWSRENIRSLLDEVHYICLTVNPVGHLRMYDSSTGKDVKLNTTSGTYEYEINTTNGFSYNAHFVTNVYESNEDEPADADFVTAVGSTYAKIRFKDDPGTQTYYITAYREPTSISSESIALEVPDEFHISHLKEGVMGLIELSDHGRSDRWLNFERELKSQIKNQLNRNKLTFMVSYKDY